MATKAGLGLLLLQLIATLRLAVTATEGTAYAVDGQHLRLRNLLELGFSNIGSTIPTDHVDEAVLARLQQMSPKELSQLAEQAKQVVPDLYGLYAPLLADRLRTTGNLSHDAATFNRSAAAPTSAAAAATRTAAVASSEMPGGGPPTGVRGCQSGFHACQGMNTSICAIDYPSNACPVPGTQPGVCGDNQAVNPRFGVCMDCAYGKNGSACNPCRPAQMTPPVTEPGTDPLPFEPDAGTAPVSSGSCANCPYTNPSNGWRCEGLTCPPGFGFDAQGAACTVCTAGTAGNGSTTFPCPTCMTGTYADTVALGSCKSCRTIAEIMDFYSRGYILAVTAQTGKRGGSISTPCNTSCPSNTASIDGVSCSACTLVPGYGLDRKGNCVPCPPGQYATSNMSSCAACPPGTTSNQYPERDYFYYDENTGNYTNQLRHVCTPRTCYLGQGLSAAAGCVWCAPGTAGNGTTAFPCPRCPRGTYSASEGSEQCDWSCNTVAGILGKYNTPFDGYQLIVDASNDTGRLLNNASLTVTGSTEPQVCDRPCPNPSTASMDGLTCSPCRLVPGFGLDAQGRCSMCPPGQYATNSMLRCAACPAGTSSNQNVNTSLPYINQLRHVCKSCGPGFLWSGGTVFVGGVSKAGAATCTPCNATVDSTAGWSWRGLACNASCAGVPGWQKTDEGCRPCERSTFSPGDGVTACTPCSSPPFLFSGTGFSNCSDNPSASSGYCFPGHARLTVLTGDDTTQEVAAADVHVGDTVQVVLSDGSLGFSKVFAMPHLSATDRATYYTLTIASGHKLQLSGSHYIYHAPSPASTWEQRVAVPAKDVTTDHVLWVVDSISGNLVHSVVTTVSLQEETGAFVFWTLEGHAVIDGTAPSSYSNTFGSEEAMDAVAQAVKRIYNVLGGKAARWLHDVGAVNMAATVLKGAFRVHKQAKAGWGAMVAPVLFTVAKT